MFGLGFGSGFGFGFGLGWACSRSAEVTMEEEEAAVRESLRHLCGLVLQLEPSSAAPSLAGGGARPAARAGSAEASEGSGLGVAAGWASP